MEALDRRDDVALDRKERVCRTRQKGDVSHSTQEKGFFEKM
jgi:hypothetical protein